MGPSDAARQARGRALRLGRLGSRALRPEFIVRCRGGGGVGGKGGEGGCT